MQQFLLCKWNYKFIYYPITKKSFPSTRLPRGQGKDPISTKANIFQVIKVDDDERADLMELESLVNSTADEKMEKISSLSNDEINSLENKLQLHTSTDLGGNYYIIVPTTWSQSHLQFIGSRAGVT